MNIEKLVTRISELSTKKGISRNQALIESGVGKNFISNLKNCKPSKGKLTMLANYFGVSINYLLGETNEKSNLVILRQDNVYKIPVYATVSAGTGAEPEDNVIGYMSFTFSSENEAQNSIFIKVKGDSMYPTIEDGDLILVHKQDTIDNGYINVILLDGEALVKKIFYDQHYIELQSINPLYPPIKLEGPDMERIHVIGRVNHVIKKV